MRSAANVMTEPSRWTADRWRLVHGLREELTTVIVSDDLANAALEADYARAKQDGVTDLSWNVWRHDRAEQVAASWVVATALVRFCEDNRLLGAAPMIAGAIPEAVRAAELSQADWLAARADGSVRDWLLAALRTIREVLPPDLSNPFEGIVPPVRASELLVDFWRERDDVGAPLWRFDDAELDTGWLIGLYEGLSEREREKNALLATPPFISSFMLDFTLDPAVRERGLESIRVADPAFGCGTLLLDAFGRLLNGWSSAHRDTPRDECVKRALGSLHGIDINPLAVTICRFRMLVAALKAAGRDDLSDSIGYSWLEQFRLGDALLIESSSLFDREEDGFDVVVCEPPYLSVRNGVLSSRYREKYPIATGAYTYVIPFMQRIFELARRGRGSHVRAGYVAQFVANSFMKREFGRRAVEELLAQQVDLTHIFDTSGVFIPGHGVPTVVLVGRNREPRYDQDIHSVVCLRGEPEVPAHAESGVVWQSVLQAAKQAGIRTEWTESRSLRHEVLRSHPLRLADVQVDEVLSVMSGNTRLADRVVRIGYYANTGSDHAFLDSPSAFSRMGISGTDSLVDVLTGSEVRDWSAVPINRAFFPRDKDLRVVDINDHPGHLRRLWPLKVILGLRPNYSGRSYFEDGRAWYDWHQVALEEGTHDWSIVFSWVSTHNHFALVRRPMAPLNSAPVIKLGETASAGDHVSLNALLNTSSVCFWLKQHSQHKGQPTRDHTGSGESWSHVYEFTSSRLRELPLPAEMPSSRATVLDRLAMQLEASSPASLLRSGPVTPKILDEARQVWLETLGQMVAMQEELDWETYRLYGLLPHDEFVLPIASVPEIRVGERAFEFVLARRVAAGELSSSWFARHGVRPVSDLPEHWPTEYAAVVKRRIEEIEKSPSIALIEQPDNKRRWSGEEWETLLQAALADWLLSQCERPEIWYEVIDGGRVPRALSVTDLTAMLGNVEEFTAMAELYSPAKELIDVVAELVDRESVPYLAAMRYRESGIRKRRHWEDVWRWQYEQGGATGVGSTSSADTVEAGFLPPPRYSSADFQKVGYWRLRGKLDVPRERFVSYRPSTAKQLRNQVVGWCGWTNGERLRVLEDLMKPDSALRAGESDTAVVPLLAGYLEILTEIDCGVERGGAIGSVVEVGGHEFLRKNQRELGLDSETLLAWRPAKSGRGRPRTR